MAKSKALVEAMSALITQQPFFAVYLLDQMNIVEKPDLEAPAATDGRTIFIEPKQFGEWTIKERVFVLAHEIMHGIMAHMPRTKLYMDRTLGPDLKPFIPMKFNHAADYVINDLLVSSGIGEAPVGLLFHPKFKKDDLVDDVYTKLPDPKNPPPKGGGGQGGGSGDGNETGGTGKGHDQHMKPNPNTPPPTPGETKRALKSAANAAKSQGKLPADLERLVEELVEPKQNWKELLRTALSNALGHDEATWSRPNRRKLAMAPHVFLPGTAGYRAGKVGVVIDTSGSIGQEELNLFLSETAGILQDGKPEQCKVFWTDSKVAGIDDVQEPAELMDLKAKGGGGTDMEAAFPVMVEEFDYAEDITAIVLTDGYTGFTQAPDGIQNVIWVSTGITDIPYGLVIHMDNTHQN